MIFARRKNKTLNFPNRGFLLTVKKPPYFTNNSSSNLFTGNKHIFLTLVTVTEEIICRGENMTVILVVAKSHGSNSDARKIAARKQNY